MMPPERMITLFAQVARQADVALIEGVMGLFDGFGYDDDTGSTAQVAIYTHHMHHLALLRKVLLRMKSWTNYLLSDGH